MVEHTFLVIDHEMIEMLLEFYRVFYSTDPKGWSNF